MSWDWLGSAFRWLWSNRRIELLQTEIKLLKTQLGLLQADVAELRRVLGEKNESQRRLEDDLRYCQTERQRLGRENHDLLMENRQLNKDIEHLRRVKG